MEVSCDSSLRSSSSRPGHAARRKLATGRNRLGIAFWVSFQGNFIRQQHPTFERSVLRPEQLSARKGSRHLARRNALYRFPHPHRLEILADVESAGGAGLSNALGIAGFTNVDVVRNPDPGRSPVRLARDAALHHPLEQGDDRSHAQSAVARLHAFPLAVWSSAPAK